MHASRTSFGTPHMHCTTLFEITPMDIPVRKCSMKTSPAKEPSTGEIGRATNREPVLECTREREEETVRSDARTDGKSTRRIRCTDTARNTHDRTSTDRTKTGDFETDKKRQETKSMTHLRSRTKP